MKRVITTPNRMILCHRLDYENIEFETWRGTENLALNWRTETRDISLELMFCQKYYSKIPKFLMHRRNKFLAFPSPSCAISLGCFTCFQFLTSLCDKVPITKLRAELPDRQFYAFYYLLHAELTTGNCDWK
jgi:hypothetical protein